jgi:hypothetical protein
MGDRTSLYLEVIASDRDPVVRAFGEPASEDRADHPSPTLLLTFDDVHGGGFDRLATLARAGLTFRGWHDSGDNYLAATFAACNGTLADVPMPGGNLMVRIDVATLGPLPADLAAAQRWRETDNQVLAHFAAHALPPGS